MSMVGLRKLWFQIHKWIGLILAIAIIPLCVTGSALVWHEPLDRALHSNRYAVAGPGTLAPQVYADAARAALAPGERLSRLAIPREAGEPVEVSATKNVQGSGRPERITVYLDPADARVIDKESSTSGIMRVMHVIHGSLMIPGWGRAIVGWIGVAMLISSLTGLWLWWPLSGSVRRGFRWKRHPKNTDSNLHHLLGFWISVPLFVLSLTGVWISFPQVFSAFDGPQTQQRGPNRAALFRAKPIEPTTSLESAVASAQAVAPGRVRSVGFPTDLKPEWAIEVAPAKGRQATVTVGDADGSAKLEKRAERPRERPQTIARTMRQIHDGGDTPFIWQLIVFLGGLLPAILAVTGIIMWARARKWRGDVAARQRARAGR